MKTHFARIAHFDGSRRAPDDLLLSPVEQARFWHHPVWVLEKLDGISVAFFTRRDGQVAADVRAPWDRALDGAVRRSVEVWLLQRQNALRVALGRGRTLYGEWLLHRVNRPYTQLPDAVIFFALQQASGRLVAFDRAMHVVERAGLTPQRALFHGRVAGLTELRRLVGRSQFGHCRMEGLIAELPRTLRGIRYGKWVESSYRKELEAMFSPRQPPRYNGFGAC